MSSPKWLVLLAIWSFFTQGSAQEVQGLQATVPVRLAAGSTPFEGRVEVFHDNEWGTVCDDQFDENNNGCAVVCHQLGYSGGTNNKGFGEGDGKIWLDDVKCLGDEPHLGMCMRSHWGTKNCRHNEDAGCVCEPLASGDGSCDSTRHRITEFNTQYPGIGRVEVQDDQGQWLTVCDDHWDDNDAAVFCQCLGFPNPEHFRAYWNGRLVDLKPDLAIGYDSVNCDPGDRRLVINLWECDVTMATGRCDPRMEAAAVACQEVPKITPPAAPEMSLQCDGQLLSVCFESNEYHMHKDFLSMSPPCASADSRETVDGVCIDIKMESCDTSVSLTDSSNKHYCYDISYSEYDSDPSTLQTDEVWLRRSCCSVAKNGTVSTSLLPRVANHSQRTLYTSANTTFSLQCFTDPYLQSSALTPLSEIQRGQYLFCRVEADTWDPRMYLVVPSCRLHATRYGDPSYGLMHDKCPSLEELDVSYFSADSHRWGFQFKVPKFQGYDALFISCDTYICDTVLDSRSYCDRTCLRGGATGGRVRRSALQMDENYVRLTQGPYTVEDRGFGPVITTSGRVQMVEPTGHSRGSGRPMGSAWNNWNVEVKEASHSSAAASRTSYFLHATFLVCGILVCLFN